MDNEIYYMLIKTNRYNYVCLSLSGSTDINRQASAKELLTKGTRQEGTCENSGEGTR